MYVHIRSQFSTNCKLFDIVLQYHFKILYVFVNLGYKLKCQAKRDILLSKFISKHWLHFKYHIITENNKFNQHSIVYTNNDYQYIVYENIYI